MNLFKSLNALLLCSAVAAAWSPAHAEGDANSTISLDTITVTTTKTEDPLIDTLAGASVVTDTEVTRFQPDRLSDILQGVPGVEVQEDADEPSSAINIRGLQDFGRVNVMIEGARQNFQRSGHGANGIFYIEPELIKAVDIVRGPVATIYGSGAVGGVVNFELKDAADLIYPGETWHLGVKGQYNTNDDGTLVSVTGAAQPVAWFDVVGNVVWQRDDDFFDGNGDRVVNTDEDVLSALVKGTLRFDGGHILKVTYLRQDNTYTTGDPGFQRETDTLDNTASAKWQYNPSNNPWIDFTASGYYTDTETDQTRIDLPFPCLPPFCDPTVLGNARNFRIRTIGTDVFNTSRFSTGPFEHALTYGGDAFRDRVRTVDPLGSGNEFTPSGQRLVYGGFVQDQIDFQDWLQVIGALRFDSYELKGGPDDVTGTRVSPKATVGITLIEGVQVYGTYAEAYRSPAITETLQTGVHPAFPAFDILPNPDLKPETARNWEGGVNLSFDNVIHDGDGFRAKGVVFQNNVDDFIELVSLNTPNPFGATQFQNIAEARLRGFELEAHYDAGFMFASVAYTHVRGDDLESDQPLVSVYPDKISTTVGFRFLDDKLTVGGRHTYAASQTRLPDPLPRGVEPSSSYHLVDLFATYDHNRYFSTALTLKNVLDEQFTRYRSEDPSPGFSATISAIIRLGG